MSNTHFINSFNVLRNGTSGVADILQITIHIKYAFYKLIECLRDPYTGVSPHLGGITPSSSSSSSSRSNSSSSSSNSSKKGKKGLPKGRPN